MTLMRPIYHQISVTCHADSNRTTMPTTVPGTMSSNCTTVVQLLDIVPGTVLAILCCRAISVESPQ